MNLADSMMHPEPQRLEAYVEGALSEAERAVVDSHLMTCARCEAAAEEWRTLFAQLAALPRPAPAAGFADRVLAGVRVHRPWAERAGEWVGRLMPQTTRGWAIAAAIVALPVLAGYGAAAWLYSRPWFSAQGLWLFVRARAVETLVAGADWAGGVVMGNTVAIWVGERGQAVLAGAGLAEIGLGLGVIAALFALSAWVVYRNVFRTPTRGVHYASYCF